MSEAFHDSAYHGHRSPLGAAACGEEITLCVRAPLTVSGGELVLHAPGFDKRYALTRAGEALTVKLSAPQKPGVYYYHFLLHGEDGSFFVGAQKNGLDSRLFSEWPDSFRLTVYFQDFETPSWFCESVMYQIMPDRFSRDSSDTAQRGLEYHRALGRRVEYHEDWEEPVKWRTEGGYGYYPNDFYGGTLRGICEKLPYLKSLGVGVIYLNPIFESDSNHRYNTADYLRVDPILGDEGDLAALCDSAAGMGIRVMLDGVFSHTGSDSVYFNKAGFYPEPGAYQGADSPYFEWFDFRRFPDEYRCWWNFPSLPEVREENPGWQDYIFRSEDSVVKRWLRAGASGWRLDVADELPDEALRGIYKSAKEEKPDCVILGEVWEDPTVKVSYGKLREYALGGALDSVMNYPLREALIDFARGKTDAFALCEFLLRQKLHYPLPMYRALMNLLSSHDVPRIRTELGTPDVSVLSGGRDAQAALRLTPEQDALAARLQAVCAAIQFSLPGVPSIYYGDERGMQGARDPFDRAPFSFAGVDLTGVYWGLSGMRGRHEAMRRGDAGFFAPDGDTLCVLRALDGQTVLTAATRSFFEKRLDLTLPGDFRGLGAKAAEGVAGKTVSLTVPPVGFIQLP